MRSEAKEKENKNDGVHTVQGRKEGRKEGRNNVHGEGGKREVLLAASAHYLPLVLARTAEALGERERERERLG